jgi:hypothetical protein
MYMYTHTCTCTLKDFPCPVLLRELMVWCWQENPDDRPTGNEIIEKCNTLHFPKLLDGIRVCDAGQVDNDYAI